MCVQLEKESSTKGYESRDAMEAIFKGLDLSDGVEVDIESVYIEKILVAKKEFRGYLSKVAKKEYSYNRGGLTVLESLEDEAVSSKSVSESLRSEYAGSQIKIPNYPKYYHIGSQNNTDRFLVHSNIQGEDVCKLCQPKYRLVVELQDSWRRDNTLCCEYTNKEFAENCRDKILSVKEDLVLTYDDSSFVLETEEEKTPDSTDTGIFDVKQDLGFISPALAFTLGLSLYASILSNFSQTITICIVAMYCILLWITLHNFVAGTRDKISLSNRYDSNKWRMSTPKNRTDVDISNLNPDRESIIDSHLEEFELHSTNGNKILFQSVESDLKWSVEMTDFSLPKDGSLSFLNNIGLENMSKDDTFVMRVQKRYTKPKRPHREAEDEEWYVLPKKRNI